MSPRSEAGYCAVIGVAMLVMFAIVALVSSDNRRLDDTGNRFENTVLHLQDFCRQNPDGSAVCRPGAFNPITTTTTAP